MRRKEVDQQTGTAKAGLTLVVGRREIPKELIERALWVVTESDLSQFALNLEVAREFWQNHRELVEAPEMPAHLEALVDLPFAALGRDEMADLRGKLMADPILAKVVTEIRNETMASSILVRTVTKHARKLMEEGRAA
jgi:hypothetical protein